MKKSIKYLSLIFVFMFVLISGVSAKVIETCYYNFSGLSPSGTPEKDAYLKVEIYDSDAKPGHAVIAKGSGLNDLVNDLPETTVENWGSDSDPINAAQYYAEHGCPPYAVYHIYKVQFANSRRLLLLDFNSVIEPNKYIGGFATRIRFFGLIKTDGELEIAETCKYGTFDINYNSKNQVVSISNNVDSEKYFPALNMALNSSNIELCQPVYSCGPIGTNSGSTINFIFYSQYEDSGFSEKDCKLKEPEENKASTSVCLTFSTLLKGNSSEGIKGMEDYWKKYSECKKRDDQACVSEEISNYNSKKDSLKSYCNSILSSKNADDPCAERCLDLNYEIYELENGNSLANKNDCGFSQNLIIWIANIIRWAKYIVPVIVIILGIIDFIKAIAGDKDDEMKKAQGRFIKRLIAAALIFIIPFIIEFVLNKMGFSSNGCGIINL